MVENTREYKADDKRGIPRRLGCSRLVGYARTSATELRENLLPSVNTWGDHATACILKEVKKKWICDSLTARRIWKVSNLVRDTEEWGNHTVWKLTKLLLWGFRVMLKDENLLYKGCVNLSTQTASDSMSFWTENRRKLHTIEEKLLKNLTTVLICIGWPASNVHGM